MENKKSMLELATEIITKSEKGIKFSKLWDEICTQLNLSDDEKKQKISIFYTQLTTSGSLVQEKDNVWNLSSKVSYEKSHNSLGESNDTDDNSNEDGDEEITNETAPQDRVEENIDGQTDQEENNEQQNVLSDFIKN